MRILLDVFENIEKVLDIFCFNLRHQNKMPQKYIELDLFKAY